MKNNIQEQPFIEIVRIKDDYIKYLHSFDNRVMLNKNESRPYLGVLFYVGNLQYFAPLSSPKPKFKEMHNHIDFYKLDNGNLGAINFNNMIPVIENQIIHLEISKLEQKYKFLILAQIDFINKDGINIVDRATRLYEKYNSMQLHDSIKNRCCNFKVLEEKAKKY